MWIHHLTHIENLESILKNGLMSRNKLKKDNISFDDTANKNIIEKRNELNNYIPFHINKLQKEQGIPYNYQVCNHHKPENMIFLNYNTDNLSNYNIKCFLYHPTSKYTKEFSLNDFENKLIFEEKKLIKDGKLDYKDNKIQQFLMSEVLINSTIYLDKNWIIISYSEIQKQKIMKILKKFNINIPVYIDSKVFV